MATASRTTSTSARTSPRTSTDTKILMVAPEGGPPKVETPQPPPAVAPCPPPGLPAFAYINFRFGTAEISGADPIPVLEDVARIMKERPRHEDPRSPATRTTWGRMRRT